MIRKFRIEKHETLRYIAEVEIDDALPDPDNPLLQPDLIHSADDVAEWAESNALEFYYQHEVPEPTYQAEEI